MSARETSILAYNQMKESGVLGKRRWEVYDWLYDHGPATTRRVTDALTFGTTSDSDCYRPRLAELDQMGVIRCVGETVCELTKMTVKVWDVTSKVATEKPAPKAKKAKAALFQLGEFVLRSGQRSEWKIEADALTPDDWEALAKMASEILPPFGAVHGVPRGGVPFANALRKYSRACSTGIPRPVLIAEDVCTTGGSMERFRAGLGSLASGWPSIGVCVFARGECPGWVTPLFSMTQRKT